MTQNSVNVLMRSRSPRTEECYILFNITLQYLVRVNNKENDKAVWGESQRVNNVESFSMSWRHHVWCNLHPSCIQKPRDSVTKLSCKPFEYNDYLLVAWSRILWAYRCHHDPKGQSNLTFCVILPGLVWYNGRNTKSSDITETSYEQMCLKSLQLDWWSNNFFRLKTKAISKLSITCATHKGPITQIPFPYHGAIIDGVTCRQLIPQRQWWWSIGCFVKLSNVWAHCRPEDVAVV